LVKNVGIMENLFVTYEQALDLKELGFDEPCFGKYDTYIADQWVLNILPEGRQFRNTNKACIAPLKQQVFKWFRDTYKIQGYIKSYTIRGGNGGQTFCDYIYVINGIGMNVIQTDARDGQFGTYEQAESACIDKLIEIVKDKK
jgi:hypothetical protein